MEPDQTTIARQRVGKHNPEATNKQAAIKELHFLMQR